MTKKKSKFLSLDWIKVFIGVAPFVIGAIVWFFTMTDVPKKIQDIESHLNDNDSKIVGMPNSLKELEIQVNTNQQDIIRLQMKYESVQIALLDIKSDLREIKQEITKSVYVSYPHTGGI